MKFEEYLDPEVAPALMMFPAELLTATGDNPPLARQMFGAMMEQMAMMVPPTEVTIEERMIPGPGGDLRVVIYQPPGDAPRPGFLWIHGGGYIIGDARDAMFCLGFAEHTGCTIVSVDYRMAPEHPAPAGTEDSHAALLWMVENAPELGIDTDFSKEKAQQVYDRRKEAAHRKLVMRLSKLCGKNEVDRAKELLAGFVSDNEYADKALLLKYLREQGLELSID